MPRISIWFVRAALLHCFFGFTAGAWQLAVLGGLPLPSIGPVRTFHVEVVMLGWIVQLAIGVAIWILPFSRGVSRDWRLWTALGLLNGGVLLVIAGALVELDLAHGLGRLAEIIAGGFVAWVLWPRVRALPSRDHS
ncbi:hypothetical protein CRI94_01005 [Longibacter salinarum]|uniref:Uncharacterized protein n=1 Tax=Longibacter salinarum TaxID=1850348 RepID=A0A2A8D1Z9_9BACT|nr:hypothetical protein [Longibacter salinarum]PEN14904.1 hypothetical protein CRI94_01005 [Longibacter salinarum]